MFNKCKYWLAGITGGTLEDLDNLTKDIYQFFDGLIFIEHNTTDGCKELLESRKGEGEIVSIPFSGNHGWQMQAILNSRKILPYDKILLTDTLENINPDFARNFKNFWWMLESECINTVYLYGKILTFTYFPFQYFNIVTPHCTLQHAQPKAIDLSHYEEWKDEKKSRYNIRPLKRPPQAFLEHFVKYCMYPSPNNQMTCGRELDSAEINKHELERQKFVYYCSRYLNIDLTVDALKDYIKKNGLDDYMKGYMNFERYFNDWYCYYFLNHSLDDILARHKTKELFKIE